MKSNVKAFIDMHDAINDRLYLIICANRSQFTIKATESNVRSRAQFFAMRRKTTVKCIQSSFEF